MTAGTGRWARLGAWLVLVGFGGLAGLAFAPTNWWPLAIVGVAGFLVHLGRAGSWRQSAWWGYGFGVGLNFVSLNWLSSLLPSAGPAIAAALALFMSGYFALMGIGLRSVQRLPAWPLWAAMVWVAGEWLYSRFPFGGFGWTRIGYPMVDAPLSGWFPLISLAGVSFVTALLAGICALFWVRRRELGAWLRPAGLVWVAVVVVLIGGGLLGRGYQVEPAAGSGEVTVGMVQGNVDGVGIGGMGRARSVTNNHYSETITLMARARAGVVPEPDFVLWPENSTDIDPMADRQTHQVVQAASDIAAVPIFVGAVLSGPGPDERQTAGLWWMPDGQVPAQYAKRNLVPFGEFIPFRDQLLPLIPLLELVGAQSIPGTSPGVIDVPLADGRQLAVGDVICFELAYDDTVRDAVRGSQVLMVQSNNATYRGTAQIEQQFVITRARAMEARREIVVATTNSVSGHIDRNGRVLERTEEMTNASNAYVMPLRTQETVAVRYGGIIESGLAAAGLVAVVLGMLRRGTSAGAAQ